LSVFEISVLITDAFLAQNKNGSTSLVCFKTEVDIVEEAPEN
jgi:hypothetical protein